LVPVQKHIANAALVEYRPHTTATAAWYGKMKESTAEWLARYEEIVRKRGSRKAAA
jgi:hypothetical protein